MAITDTSDMRPKRSRGRPKGSKNKSAPVVYKYRKLDSFTITVPQIPIWWRVRKMAWLVQNIEMHLKNDPLSVPPKQYFDLLRDLEAAYNKLNEKGLGSHAERKAYRDRVRSKNLGEERDELRSSRVGEEELVGVGTGVPATDPFGG